MSGFAFRALHLSLELLALSALSLAAQQVPLVRNDADSARWNGPEWRVSDKPATTIGAADGDEAYALFRVFWASRLSNGNIVLLNSGTNEFRVFDSRGVFLYAFGGEGDGPGELRRPESATLLGGDSLVVQDGFRLTVFGPDGSYARTFAVKGGRPLPPQLLGRLGNALVFRDGDFASREFTVGADGRFRTVRLAAGLDQGRYAFARYSAEGGILDTIGTFRGGESWITIEGTRQHFTSVPFGRNQQTGIGAGLLVTGWTDSFRLEVYDARGLQRRVIEMRAPQRRVSDADFWARFRRAYESTSLQVRRETEERYRAMPRYETAQAFGRVKVDPLGYIWVEATSRSDFREPTPWWVFDSSGRALGAVRMPDMWVLDIGEDYVLGRVQDDFDVERIVLHRLSRN